jgi:hypothetical protein
MSLSGSAMRMILWYCSKSKRAARSILWAALLFWAFCAWTGAKRPGKEQNSLKSWLSWSTCPLGINLSITTTTTVLNGTLRIPRFSAHCFLYKKLFPVHTVSCIRTRGQGARGGCYITQWRPKLPGQMSIGIYLNQSRWSKNDWVTTQRPVTQHCIHCFRVRWRTVTGPRPGLTRTPSRIIT